MADKVLSTTGKPVRTLEDAKGLVIRSTGVGAAIAVDRERVDRQGADRSHRCSRDHYFLVERHDLRAECRR